MIQTYRNIDTHPVHTCAYIYVDICKYRERQERGGRRKRETEGIEKKIETGTLD